MNTTSRFYLRYAKRPFDLLLAIPALIILSPVLLLVAAVVRFKLGSPILFRQQRPGLHGQPFTIIKFRTMTEARDKHGNLLSEGERLTAIGRFLRSTSLDELPELWNVIRGEMSWVGPRPLLMQYLALYSPEQARRHQVRPGITGWAQVNGRNAISWDDKFRLDVWYVDHASFAVDMEILYLTIVNVLSRQGISPPGQEIMPRFTGSPSHDLQPTERQLQESRD